MSLGAIQDTVPWFDIHTHPIKDPTNVIIRDDIDS